MKKKYILKTKKTAIALFLYFIGIITVVAQKTISGTVTDVKGEGIPGVSIQVKGTTKGTISDIEGSFKISLSGNGGVLVVSSVGYIKQEIAINNQSEINIKLVEDASTLQEVVVTGYQTQNRKEITGAVSIVKSSELEAVPSGNVEQQLQGRVAGLTLITNGQPGTDSKVRLRGFGSYTGNEPLYIVDGVPTSSISFLAPADIDNTTVLKDAASASIYGARAANGVIVISTRKGEKAAQKLSISYSGTFGVTIPGKGYQIMNPQQTADWTWTAMKNTPDANGNSSIPSSPQYGKGATPVLPTWLLDVYGNTGIVGSVDIAANKALYNIDPTSPEGVHQLIQANWAGTNWWKEITQKAILNRHSLGFSGGGTHSRYYLGLDAQSQQGILRKSGLQRYNLRTNSEFNISKHFRIGENIQLSYINLNGLIGANGGQGVSSQQAGILVEAARMNPIIPVYDYFGGWAGTRANGFNNTTNPVAMVARGQNNLNYSVLSFGNIYGEYDLLPNLTFRSSLGGSYMNNYRTTYAAQTYENAENSPSSVYTEQSLYSLTWAFTNTLAYQKKIGKNSLAFLGGMEALNTNLGYNTPAKGRMMVGTGTNPFSANVNYVTLQTVSNKLVNSYLYSGVNFYSLFAKVDYAYDEKYLLSATLRRDGSSAFGQNNRYGVFPAFSAAWRISSESFMKNMTFISDLKLRVGWGQMGNSNNISPQNQYNLYGQSIDYSSYDISGSNSGVVPGFYQSQLGNPNAKWETNTTTNAGFDATLFRGKMEIIFDYWRKITTNLLYTPSLALVTGATANAPAVNIGSMMNRGIDFQLINRGKISGDFNFETNLTLSFLKNEVTALAPGTPYFEVPVSSLLGNGIRNQVGLPLSSFFGYQVQGIFTNNDQVAKAATQSGAAPGTFRFVDINGDGKIDPNDRTFLGSPIPTFNGGLNLKVKYKNYEISSFFYTVAGNKIFNGNKYFTDFYASFPGSSISTKILDSWTPTNTNTTIPQFSGVSNFSTNGQVNSYYVENGAYLRMQNLQLSYNVPSGFLKNWKIETARVYVQATNLFTITKYSGLDPGVGGATDSAFGVDTGNYPISKGFNVGVNLSF